MIFEYQQVTKCEAQIDIDDIGNCCLISRNVLGEESYLYILTQIGLTQVITYGPIVPDFDQLPANVSYKYQRFDYNDRKVEGIIEKFVSTAEYVECVNIEDIRQNIKPMLDNLEIY